MSWFQIVTDWTNEHHGLGAWIDAVGTTAAVIVTWFLARAEFLRTKRQVDARKNSEIDLIRSVVSRFESLLVQKCISAVNASRAAEADEFRAVHLNDPEMHSMIDLAHVPVTQWPSIETYTAFKQYWFHSLKIFEYANSAQGNEVHFKRHRKEHDIYFPQVLDALNKARP